MLSSILLSLLNSYGSRALDNIPFVLLQKVYIIIRLNYAIRRFLLPVQHPYLAPTNVAPSTILPVSTLIILIQPQNKIRLVDLNNPVLLLIAKYDDQTIGQRASVKEYSQLELEIQVSIRYKLILLNNIQTEASLVNSTTRILYDIKQALDTIDPRNTLPYCLIIKFPTANYTRLYLNSLNNTDEVTILIFLAKRNFYYSRQEHYREQFPIRLAFAITVYKVQGSTLNKAIIDITTKEFTPRLRYVAILRIKTLQGLIFKKPFDYSLFTNRLIEISRARIADIKRRANQVLLLETTSRDTQDTTLSRYYRLSQHLLAKSRIRFSSINSVLDIIYRTNNDKVAVGLD